MKQTWIILLIILLPLFAKSQKFKSDKSYVKFFSDAPMEDITAENTEGVSIFDIGSGAIAFSIPIKGFQFKKALMQEHFNEKYLESDKYPKATFKGTVKGYDKSVDGKQEATATGTMRIHGVSKQVEVEGTVIIDGENITIDAVFPVTVADYDIEIPKVVFYNIAEVVEVTVNFEYEKI